MNGSTLASKREGQSDMLVKRQPSIGRRKRELIRFQESRHQSFEGAAMRRKKMLREFRCRSKTRTCLDFAPLGLTLFRQLRTRHSRLLQPSKTEASCQVEGTAAANGEAYFDFRHCAVVRTERRTRKNANKNRYLTLGFSNSLLTLGNIPGCVSCVNDNPRMANDEAVVIG